MAGKILALAALLTLSGCAVPIAAGLDEGDANRIVVALEDNGLAAHKEPDTQIENRWRVSVARDDASAATAVLTRESLPTPAAPGVLDALGKSSVVPSRTAEHARYVTGTAGELERSLRAVDGILSVRVHLAVPPTDPLAGEDKPVGPTASVLMRHRGATPPVATADVQRLVAGAVPGLLPTQVSVVSSSVPAAGRPPERELSRLGPITVTRASMPPLRIVVGAAALLNIVLLGLVAVLWSRTKKQQMLLAERPAEAVVRDRGQLPRS
jgi:type III secretion protein J